MGKNRMRKEGGAFRNNKRQTKIRRPLAKGHHPFNSPWRPAAHKSPTLGGGECHNILRFEPGRPQGLPTASGDDLKVAQIFSALKMTPKRPEDAQDAPPKRLNQTKFINVCPYSDPLMHWHTKTVISKTV